MRFFVLFLLTLCLLLAGSAVFAQTSASQPTQPTLIEAPTVTAPADLSLKGQWNKITKAFKEGRYRELVGLIITILVAFWRRYFFGFILWRLSSWWQGFLVCAMSFVGVIGTSLVVQDFNWGTFILDTICASGEAMLFWQMILKKIKYFKEGKQNQPPAASADTPATPPSDLAEAHP